MSDSEEEDYMSEKYLIQAEQQEKKQPQTYSERRKQATREHERKAYIAPRAQMEQKAREEGLKQSVSEDNKGMQMLMKMGFKYVNVVWLQDSFYSRLFIGRGWHLASQVMV